MIHSTPSFPLWLLLQPLQQWSDQLRADSSFHHLVLAASRVKLAASQWKMTAHADANKAMTAAITSQCLCCPSLHHGHSITRIGGKDG
jgi:hypothetical protein